MHRPWLPLRLIRPSDYRPIGYLNVFLGLLAQGLCDLICNYRLSPRMVMEAQADDKFIEPLTGLRFVAAATVAIGHAAPSLRDDWLGHLIAQISSVGMTLFFVLSGFVLWLTYSERILKSPRAALRDFATG